jgi:serine/threonine protein kinase
MPDYSELITAYARKAIDYDTLAAALFRWLETSPASLPAILTQLEEVKKSRPADLPLIQKLQKELRDYSPSVSEAPSKEAYSSGSGERTIIKGHIESAEAEDQAKTVVKNVVKNVAKTMQEALADNGVTVIKPVAEDATRVQPSPPPPAAEPEEKTRLQEPAEATRLEPQTVAPETEVSPAGKLEPGSVIKNRFILEDLLGEGGMGRVFKARDLRKEEAHDRNPYVAIKVLRDSFKDHPQAFIALQREAKKAQTLAHPNIVNVFDFDRDGDTVYMTMEHLEGNSLDRMIRQRLPRPFEKPQAIKIIQGICQGLSYAHKRNIIHSDLKPGNVFVTKEGEVKIFDFGIARAIQAHEADGEKTLFDAGSLGGLTPAYASCEMFEGEEPDVRDDIYALACIAYELLGGKHPFNKTPAIKAKQLNLTVERLPQLSRRQNNTLIAGLAFEREARIPSVDQFIEALTARFSKIQKISIAVAIVLVISAIIAYDPIVSFYRQQRIEAYVAQIETGDKTTIQTVLKKLAKLPHALRDEILAAAKEPLITYYEQQAFARIDIEHGIVDFNGAYRYLNIANALFPDSAQISAAKKQLQQREQSLSNELSARLNFHLKQGNLLPNDTGDDLLDVLNMAAKINPQHPLLSDKRIAVEYAKRAREAANQWDFDRAQDLLNVARQVVPGNSDLQALQQTINAQEQQYLARQEKIAGKSNAKTLRREVEALLNNPFGSANWSRSVKAAMDPLEQMLPANDAWLKDTKRQIALYHVKRAENLKRQGKFGEARSVLQLAESFDPDAPGLAQEKTNLAQAEEHAVQRQKVRAQQQLTTDLKQQLLREANNNNVKKAEELLQRLSTLLDKQDPFMQSEAPNAIANAYARLSVNALQRGKTDSAAQWIGAGLAVAPQHKELAALKAKLPKKSSDACEPAIAGYGKRQSCHDVLRTGKDATRKGPTLVVVPAPKDGKPYAIGKYETSIGDFEVFCQATKSCSVPGGDHDLPITNVSYDDMKHYVQWLSAQTSATYRLPSKSEWVHAAKATAQPAGKDFNCRVTIGDNVIKGNALLSVKSGKMNSWGLFNYVGNAQELVVDPTNKLIAMGGAYQDPLAQCNITFSRKHDGKPDSVTGFRVLREL